MKNLKLIAIIIMLFVPTLTMAGDYVSFELYPQGDFFIAAGTCQDNGAKIDVWTNVGSEVGTTPGAHFKKPVGLDFIDSFKLGFGPSLMTVTEDGRDTQDLGYLNFDMFFKLNVGKFEALSYTMWQNSQHASIDDFWFNRTTVSYGDLPVGLFGHTKQSGDDPVEPFWGLYYDFGAAGPTSSNWLAVSFNLDQVDKKDGTPADKIWAAWIINF